MGDIMTPIPFNRIMDRLLEEMDKEGSCYGVKKAYKADKNKFYTIFGRSSYTARTEYYCRILCRCKILRA